VLVKRIRVLVVDDSAFARKVIREVLAADPGMEVVDIARDGLEALEKIAELAPDVVTLDLVMPNLDGLGVLRALPAEKRPRVVVVSTSDADSERGLAALDAGAVDLVHKPTALASERLYLLGDELRAKVRLAAGAVPRPVQAPPGDPVVMPGALVATRLVVIGASTGGPPALTRLIAALPEDLPCAVAVAVHLPVEYTGAFARRLNDAARLHVAEAEDGAPLLPGTVLVARGGMHLRLRAVGDALVARLDAVPLDEPHRPSVDVLFASAAKATGAATLGVVLTGMGDDGLRGAGEIKAAGGRILTESESSCVVYGMPRVVVQAGLSDGEAPIERMAAAIVARL
jgi:two-component system, chemotaxis family, protein-glutamate methylesterase/glutaminase